MKTGSDRKRGSGRPKGSVAKVPRPGSVSEKVVNIYDKAVDPDDDTTTCSTTAEIVSEMFAKHRKIVTVGQVATYLNRWRLGWYETLYPDREAEE